MGFTHVANTESLPVRRGIELILHAIVSAMCSADVDEDTHATKHELAKTDPLAQSTLCRVTVRDLNHECPPLNSEVGGHGEQR